ncbi:hypothetical protein AB0M19_30270, partial [Streptomyces sp. NPDC051920]|uniref:hypothetical protein n=1 Tax=Streptomyces sp. NPDC051920 TaxID=3155523 RepID=UPI00343E75F3
AELELHRLAGVAVVLEVVPAVRAHFFRLLAGEPFPASVRAREVEGRTACPTTPLRQPQQRQDR